METGPKVFRYNEWKWWLGPWCQVLSSFLPAALYLASGWVPPQLSRLHYMGRINHLTQLWEYGQTFSAWPYLLTCEIQTISCCTGLWGLNKMTGIKVPPSSEKKKKCLTDDSMLKTLWGSCHRRVVNCLILGGMVEMDSWPSESLSHPLYSVELVLVI